MAIISPDAKAAYAAMADRELCRRRLLHFTKRFRPRYSAGWVHEVICHELEKFSKAVEEEKSPRLMLLLPPRAGKSTLASEAFPAWHLGNFPNHEVIAASYNISLPLGFSRKVRAQVRDPAYTKIFVDAQLDTESQAAESWLLTSGGGYIAAGVGVGITGRGAHVLCIDDPIKDAKEADSASVRDDLWDWYTSTAYTRLSPGGGVLLIQTSWNEDDMAGRIQLQMKEDTDSDQFRIVKFPAIAEEDEYLDADFSIYRASEGDIPEGTRRIRAKGEALHPERYNVEMLRKIERTLTKRHWSALYQQNPTPEDGLYFERDQFLPVIDLPGNKPRARGYIYQAWDLAVSATTRSDFTVGATIEQDYEDNIEVKDIVRGKWTDGDSIVEHVLDSFEKWMPDKLGIEDGHIWKTMSATFWKRASERGLFPNLVLLKHRGEDKGVRAIPLQVLMQRGRVRWPKNAPWYEAAEREFLRFMAGGAHDDQVDAASYCAIMAADAAPPPVPRALVKKSWRDKLPSLLRSSGAVSHQSA